VKAASEREFDAAFTGIVQAGAGALLVGGSPVFINRRRQLVTLSVRHALPAVHTSREYPEAGGLMSYGPNLADARAARLASCTRRLVKKASPPPKTASERSRTRFAKAASISRLVPALKT
jgi:putative ABC transport system substrate-binding protein